MNLPPSHKPYIDKYFDRTNQILKAENLNPRVSMKVFTRGQGRVAGLEEAVEVLLDYTDLGSTGEIWTTKKDTYETKEPLMIIKGPAQSFVEMETMYLGVLSQAISKANGLKEPEPAKIKEKFERLADIYKDIPIIYFGARHYHWKLDSMIAKAALEGGAKVTSTDIGSQHVGLKGVGTTPHILTLILAHYYGIENATRKTAELFDKHMDPSIPRVALVDTFNRELTDSLSVAEYFGKRENNYRIDTCGENIGEGGTPFIYGRDPTFQTGTGVTIELARNLRKNLIDNGYGEYTNTFLSSSFGDEEKARAFVFANKIFKEQTGFDLFTGVGIGEVSEAIFCTADPYEVEDKPMFKTGREFYDFQVDYQNYRRAA